MSNDASSLGVGNDASLSHFPQERRALILKRRGFSKQGTLNKTPTLSNGHNLH